MAFSWKKALSVGLTVAGAVSGTGLVSGALWVAAAAKASNSKKWNKYGDNLALVAGAAGLANSAFATEGIADSSWRQQLGGWNQSAGLVNQVDNGAGTSATQAMFGGQQNDAVANLSNNPSVMGNYQGSDFTLQGQRQAAFNSGLSPNSISLNNVGGQQMPNYVTPGSGGASVTNPLTSTTTQFNTAGTPQNIVTSAGKSIPVNAANTPNLASQGAPGLINGASGGMNANTMAAYGLGAQGVGMGMQAYAAREQGKEEAKAREAAEAAKAEELRLRGETGRSSAIFDWSKPIYRRGLLSQSMQGSPT